MPRVLPSLASADQANLAAELMRIEGAPGLHIDIEDGNFIPNITFGMRTIHDIRPHWKGPMDAHLMVIDPMRWIDDLSHAGFAKVAMHIETLPYPMDAINKARDAGLGVGLALNPVTPASVVVPYLDEVDYLLIMTAEPDGRGQEFRPALLDKLAFLLEARPSKCELWVDGGVGTNEFEKAREAGADVVVAGRWVFQNAESPVPLPPFPPAEGGRS